MIKNFFTTAWRTLRKHKSIHLLNIVGLSAGMTSAILIFLWVQNEMSYDDYHPGADRLYRVTAHITSANWTWESTPLALIRAVRSELPEVESATCFQSAYNVNFRVGDEFIAEKQGAYVDSAWFNNFHYTFLEGNAASFSRDPYSLILTRTKAKKYFGDKDALGQTIRIDTVDYRVAGIIDDVPANSSFPFDVFIPLDALLSNADRRKEDEKWNNFNYQTYLKLRPGVRPAKVAEGITTLLRRNSEKENRSYLSLIALKDIHFENDLTSSNGLIVHGSRSTVTVFSILGIFLLLIACINYVNLTTARASLRAKEVGIRKVIGADRASLFFQFIVEALVVSLFSLLITLLLVQLSMPLFRELTDKAFRSPFLLPGTWKILGITLAASVLLTGLYPALMISSFRPLNVLKGVLLLRFKDVWLRKSLVVLQFTFSIILITSTLLIRQQLDYIQHSDPGYNRSQVLSVNMNFLRRSGNMGPLTRSLKQQLAAQTGIEGVTVASQSIVQLYSSNSGSADWDGHDTSFRPTIFQLSADEDYKKVMQLQMKEGRWFNAENQTDGHNFILNETAVEVLNIRRPVIGARFVFQGDTGKIVGVVKDFHFHSLHEKIKPLVVLNKDKWRSTFFVRTTPGGSARALAAARALVRQYDPSRPFDYAFLDDQFDNLYKSDRRASTLILLFSVIAILISCLGLLGLTAFMARQKIKEIGIRKVLGASVIDIVTLLSKAFVRLVLLSMAIAMPIAWWAMHQWLQGFAYHISLSAWIFLLAGTIALLLAIFTVGVQSVGAAAANPVKNLRTE